MRCEEEEHIWSAVSEGQRRVTEVVMCILLVRSDSANYCSKFVEEH